MSEIPTNPGNHAQPDLQGRRRAAVQLRLDGFKLQEVAEKTGLSRPTIINAYKAYLAGGWSAVQSRPQGRPKGDGGLSEDIQSTLRKDLVNQPPESINDEHRLWSIPLVTEWLKTRGHNLTGRSVGKYLTAWGIYTENKAKEADPETRPHTASNEHWPLYHVTVRMLEQHTVFLVRSNRRKLFWLCSAGAPTDATCIDFFERLSHTAGCPLTISLEGIEIARVEAIQHWLDTHREILALQTHSADRPRSATDHSEIGSLIAAESADQRTISTSFVTSDETMNEATASVLETNTDITPTTNTGLTHLQRLEAESLQILREVYAEAERPVMMFSMGKDSAVLLHVAKKAFRPAGLPIPLLHVDTTWKFRAMYEYRARLENDPDIDLLIHTNADGITKNVNPFTHGSALHTDIMKTAALKQALDKHRFDVVVGGARRDEEKSRAKERVFSFRSKSHRWDPRNQRPELWQLYNSRKQPGESIRVFPLSNWTELDIWQYIWQEQIDIVPLYMAAERPVVERDGMLIMVDDDRMPLHPGEVPMMKSVRFRTLGCYPLTAAIESTASTITEVIGETLLTRQSERQGRLIDHDASASMEAKKQEGYF